MRLFELDEAYNLVFHPELFLLKDYRDLRDARNDVDILYKELGYIYYFCDMKSEFQFEVNPLKREEDIKRFVGLAEDWKADELVKTCIDVYHYLSQTVSSRLLETAYLTVDKFDQQIRDIDLNERDKNGKPIWNQKQIMDLASSIPSLLKTVTEAESEFLKNEKKETRLKGDKVKTLYEDGFKKMKLGS